MSTHNICFHGEIRKIFTGYPPLSRPMGPSFPAAAQQDLLSLLVCKRVFFPCWWITWLSFPAGASQGLLSLLINILLYILPWQPNKLATGHKTNKLVRQSPNDHNCQIWFTSIHLLWRKCNLTIFPLKSMGPFSCHNNQTKTKWQITIILAIFQFPYLSNIPT